MATSYIRGANPFGSNYAVQGALFKQALQAGYTGAPIMGSIAPGAIKKFFAPIGESHCIAFYQGGMREGPSVPLNGWANLVEAWMLKYGIQGAGGVVNGAPVNDRVIPSSDASLVNGVYQIQVASGIAPSGSSGTGTISVRRALL